jgi:hypothetical protein
MDLIDVFPAPDFPMSRTFFFDILPRVDWNSDLADSYNRSDKLLVGHWRLLQFSSVTLGSLQKVKSNCDLSGNEYQIRKNYQIRDFDRLCMNRKMSSIDHRSEIRLGINAVQLPTVKSSLASMIATDSLLSSALQQQG